MEFPADCKYTDTHEWVKMDGTTATIGITAFAAGELGDVVFVDIPELRAVNRGESCGSIEAVKTVSDIIAPLSGTMIEKNEALDGTPDLVNSDPYGAGWMVKMTISDPAELDSLMDATAYAAMIGQ